MHRNDGFDCFHHDIHDWSAEGDLANSFWVAYLPKVDDQLAGKDSEGILTLLEARLPVILFDRPGVLESHSFGGVDDKVPVRWVFVGKDEAHPSIKFEYSRHLGNRCCEQ